MKKQKLNINENHLREIIKNSIKHILREETEGLPPHTEEELIQEFQTCAKKLAKTLNDAMLDFDYISTATQNQDLANKSNEVLDLLWEAQSKIEKLITM
jgi:hypothetical protein